MTAIVGIEYGERVVMAADPQSTSSTYKQQTTEPKIFPRSGLLIGYTSSFRFGQILEHHLPDIELPSPDEDGYVDTYGWLVTRLIPVLRELLSQHGYGKDEVGGWARVGWAGRTLGPWCGLRGAADSAANLPV